MSENLITYDREFHWCQIETDEFLKETLGKPLELPKVLQESLSQGWALDSEESLCSFFREKTGEDYHRVFRDNTFNSDTDLSDFFVFSVYAPVGTLDWVWSHNCFVAVEVGYYGDPRYVNYKPACVYFVEDCIGDTNFLSWKLNWFGLSLGGEMSSDESLSSYHLSQRCYSDPVWSERRQGFVARFRDSKKPMVFFATI